MVAYGRTIHAHLIKVVIHDSSWADQRSRLDAPLELVTSIQIEKAAWVLVPQSVYHGGHVLHSAIVVGLVEIRPEELSGEGSAVNVVGANDDYLDVAAEGALAEHYAGHCQYHKESVPIHSFWMLKMNKSNELFIGSVNLEI